MTAQLTVTWLDGHVETFLIGDDQVYKTWTQGILHDTRAQDRETRALASMGDVSIKTRDRIADKHRLKTEVLIIGGFPRVQIPLSNLRHWAIDDAPEPGRSDENS